MVANLQVRRPRTIESRDGYLVEVKVDEPYAYQQRLMAHLIWAVDTIDQARVVQAELYKTFTGTAPLRETIDRLVALGYDLDLEMMTRGSTLFVEGLYA